MLAWQTKQTHGNTPLGCLIESCKFLKECLLPRIVTPIAVSRRIVLVGELSAGHRLQTGSTGYRTADLQIQAKEGCSTVGQNTIIIYYRILQYTIEYYKGSNKRRVSYRKDFKMGSSFLTTLVNWPSAATSVKTRKHPV